MSLSVLLSRCASSLLQSMIVNAAAGTTFPARSMKYLFVDYMFVHSLPFNASFFQEAFFASPGSKRGE